MEPKQPQNHTAYYITATLLCIEHIQGDLSAKCAITNLYHKFLGSGIPQLKNRVKDYNVIKSS